MVNRSNENNLLILHEDNHIIVINKRCGDIVQGDKIISIKIIGDFSPDLEIQNRIEEWNKILDS